jgi:hypothetical protein
MFNASQMVSKVLQPKGRLATLLNRGELFILLDYLCTDEIYFFFVHANPYHDCVRMAGSPSQDQIKFIREHGEICDRWQLELRKACGVQYVAEGTLFWATLEAGRRERIQEWLDGIPDNAYGGFVHVPYWATANTFVSMRSITQGEVTVKEDPIDHTIQLLADVRFGEVPEGAAG